MRKQSFLEKLTGTIQVDDELELEEESTSRAIHHRTTHTHESEDEPAPHHRHSKKHETEEEEADGEGQLAIDMYETEHEIVIQSMVAGVTPEHLNVTITRDMVAIHGKRIAPEGIHHDNYLAKELFWGSFSREIELPTEVDTEGAEAVEKYGLLIIRLPKLNAARTQRLEVRSI